MTPSAPASDTVPLHKVPSQSMAAALNGGLSHAANSRATRVPIAA